MDEEQREKDLSILKQAYDGNHLEPLELERFGWLCDVFVKEFQRRIR